ncbi:hypothetical protein [Spirosoma aerophilum]
MRSRGCLYYLAILFIIVVVFGSISFYGGKLFDRYQRPWAYSETEPLLVGRWQGEFKDPEGITKKLVVDIVPPTTDEERLGKVFSKRRRSFSSKRAFDGTAAISSKRGNEFYEVWGSVGADDYHTFSLNYRTTNQTQIRRENFYLTDSKQNSWKNDTMTLELSFSFRRADGSSFWNSADPKYSKKVKVSLHRITA